MPQRFCDVPMRQCGRRREYAMDHIEGPSQRSIRLAGLAQRDRPVEHRLQSAIGDVAVDRAQQIHDVAP
ncbi:hypothetical protein D3C72_2044780 [compost metagenome]